MNKNIFFLCNTFTSESCKGNPTPVYIMKEMVSKTAMQQIAKEQNHPVTVFVKWENNGSPDYQLYYFTPETEIPACGHATLAAAKAVNKLHYAETVLFTTVDSKIIQTKVTDDYVTLIYPKYTTECFDVNDELIQSLQLKQWSCIGYCRELESLFIETDPRLLYNVQPDFKSLLQSTDKIKELVITSRSTDEEYDYLLRSFCPWIGIDEDPVTGSVHSVLAGYWAGKLNKQKLKAYQASERGGKIFVTSHGSSTEIGGVAVLLEQGEMVL